MMRPTSPRLRSVTAVLGLVGLLSAGARPAAAADWTLTPAANHFGGDRERYGYTLDPGGQLEDGVVIVNDGAAPVRLRVYAADAFTGRSGDVEVHGEDARPAGVGAWVHPAAHDVTVASGGSVELPFSLAVPKHAAAGDYAGGIVTSQAGERVDIPIRLRVGGALKPRLSVGDVSIHDNAVTYTIHNTGNAILSARQSVSVSGPFGRFAARARAVPGSPALLPGARWRVSARVNDVTPAVRLTATVTLIPLLTDAAGSVAPLPAVTGSGHAWAIPWSLVLAVLVLVLAGVAFRLRRRLDAMFVARTG